MPIILLFIMIFLHIFDDYYLQGILASLKQKEWWEKNVNNKLYKHDYLCALLTHAFSWTFTILLPFTISMIYKNDYSPINIWLISFVMNWGVHSIVDDLKANDKKINLIQDQLIHLMQILLTWGLIVTGKYI